MEPYKTCLLLSPKPRLPPTMRLGRCFERQWLNTIFFLSVVLAVTLANLASTCEPCAMLTRITLRSDADGFVHPSWPSLSYPGLYLPGTVPGVPVMDGCLGFQHAVSPLKQGRLIWRANEHMAI